MFTIEIIRGVESELLPEIVWRNPEPVHTQRRRRTFESTGEGGLYILQEFVFDENSGHWATIGGLEVVGGGRVA